MTNCAFLTSVNVSSSREFIVDGLDEVELPKPARANGPEALRTTNCFSPEADISCLFTVRLSTLFKRWARYCAMALQGIPPMHAGAIRYAIDKMTDCAMMYYPYRPIYTACKLYSLAGLLDCASSYSSRSGPLWGGLASQTKNKLQACTAIAISLSMYYT